MQDTEGSENLAFFGGNNNNEVEAAVKITMEQHEVDMEGFFGQINKEGLTRTNYQKRDQQEQNNQPTQFPQMDHNSEESSSQDDGEPIFPQ